MNHEIPRAEAATIGATLERYATGSLV
jgi:hypothetical protein